LSETFIWYCFAHPEDVTGDFALVYLDLAFFCDAVDLGELFWGDFADLLFTKLQGVPPTRDHLDTHVEPSSGPNTAIKKRPEETRRPKQKCRNMNQESPRLPFCVNQTLNPDV
jgi:hypothetical protein